MRTILAVALPAAFAAFLWFGAIAPAMQGITQAVQGAAHASQAGGR